MTVAGSSVSIILQCNSVRPRVTTRLSFPNLSLGEFQAQNTVTETGHCLGVKMELMKQGYGGPQTL